MQKEIIKQMEEYAEINNIPIMEKKGINFLCKFIEKNEIEKILEIGTAIGYSAIRMALVNENIEITTIERDEKRYLEAVKNIKKCNLDKRITPILGDALEIDIKGKYDMLFIDAAKGQYLKFFDKYTKNLNDDGVIVSDNMSFHGLVENPETIRNRNTKQLVNKIKKFIKFLEENEEYETKFYKIGDTIAITVKRED